MRLCAERFVGSLKNFPKKKLFGAARLAIFLSLLGICLLSFSSYPCWGATSTCSLQVINQPLGKVLKRLYELTGYEITVDEDWMSFPVTVKLTNLTLEQGLKRILRGLDHAMVFQNEEKKIFVHIHAQSPIIRNQKVSFSSNESPHQMNKQNLKRSQLQGSELNDLELIPPEDGSGDKIIQNNWKAEYSFQKMTESRELELVPPNSL
jgi:hypothetical protein